MFARFLCVFFLVYSMTSITEAELVLARSGAARAVIVSPHPVTAAPRGSNTIAMLSVSSPHVGVLLRETFDGPIGQSVDAHGWTTTAGEIVFGAGKQAGARPQKGNEFSGSAQKAFPAPHTLTDDDPLILEYVLTLPAGHREESWTSVRLDASGGNRWAFGIQNRKGDPHLFDMPSEPNDADRVPVPAEAGAVLDLKFVLERRQATWSWRIHGSGEPWRQIASQYTETADHETDEPVKITGVSLNLFNHIDNTLQDKAATREIAATKELRRVLQQVTGARFDVVGLDDVPGDASRILIGDVPASRALTSDVDWDTLGADEILIRTVGRDVVLGGGWPRGTVYAIYTFLQDVVGCRWWAPGAETIPLAPNLAVPELNVRYRSPFAMRVFRSEIGIRAEAAGWHRLSFDLSFDAGTHSFPKLLPPELAFEHPEWFAYYRDDGDENKKYSYLHTLKSYRKTLETETDRDDLPVIRRYLEVVERHRRQPGYPCLSSEGARQKITENALADFEKEHVFWKFPPRIAWVLQGDGGYKCQCDGCETLRREEGSDSAAWMRLVNAIAEEVEKKYPDVMVGMFAYLDTERPPKTLTPRKNVLVYQALLRRNFLDPVSHYPFHADSMKTWGRIATRLFVWDYDTSFRNYCQPHPNYYVNGENMKFFRDVGVDGIMVQSAVGEASDFGAMRTWVTARMMWDPDQDPRKLTEEFATGYYGPASPFVMKYLDAMVAAAHRKEDYWLACYRNDTTGWLMLEDVHAALSLFDQAAEAVKGDAVLAQRVWMAGRAIDFAWLDRYDEFKADAEARGIELGLPDPAEVVDTLAPYRNAWGKFREGPRPNDFYAYFDRLREQFPARSSEVAPN